MMIRWICKDCSFDWNGDEHDDDCPMCESDDIKKYYDED